MRRARGTVDAAAVTLAAVEIPTVWSLIGPVELALYTGTALLLLARRHRPVPVLVLTLHELRLEHASLEDAYLGVVAAATEYRTAHRGDPATGMLGTSVQAVSQRGVLLSGKAAVVFAVALLTGCATSVTAFLTGQAALGDLATPLSAPGVLRAVLGGGLHLAMLALFALGVATALRHALLALGLLVPLFFLVSPLLGTLPATARFAAYLPDAAGSHLAEVRPAADGLGPWSGLAVLALWVAAALAAAYATLRTRDVRQG